MRRILVLLAVAGLAAGAEPARNFGMIGLINLAEVLHDARIISSRMEGLQKENQAAMAEIDRLRQLEKDEQSRLEVLPRNDPRVQDGKDKIEQYQLTLKQYQERVGKDLERRQIEIVKEGYAVVRAHLAEFCRDHGIKLVFQTPQDLDAPNMDYLQVQLSAMSVQYYDPALDITKPFLEYLNGSFQSDEERMQAQGHGAAQQPPAAPAPNDGLVAPTAGGNTIVPAPTITAPAPPSSTTAPAPAPTTTAPVPTIPGAPPSTAPAPAPQP